MAKKALVYFDYSIFTDATIGSLKKRDKNLNILVKYIKSLGIDIYISNAVLVDILIYNEHMKLDVSIDTDQYVMLKHNNKFKDITLDLYSIDTDLTFDIPISLHANIAICALNNVDYILSYDMPVFMAPDFIVQATKILEKYKLTLPMIYTPDTFYKITNDYYSNLAYCFALSVKDIVVGNDNAPEQTYIKEVIRASKIKSNKLSVELLYDKETINRNEVSGKQTSNKIKDLKSKAYIKLNGLIARKSDILASIATLSGDDNCESSCYVISLNDQLKMTCSKIKQTQLHIYSLNNMYSVDNCHDKATLGSRVTIKYIGNNNIASYTIVTDGMSDIKEGYLSINAPLAKSIIGNKAGDNIRYDTPSGSRSVKILKIEPGV